jgi:methylation protein EvaC
MLCHFCKYPCTPINDFGPMPIANGFYPAFVDNSFRFQLGTMFCNTCKLFQLIEQPTRELMFNEDYPFFTGLSKNMTNHFKDFALKDIAPLISNIANPLIVEIGSNDGTLLQFFSELGLNCLGVDPSESAVLKARSQGFNVMCDFFTQEKALEIKRNHSNADVIIAANVICHVPDLRDLFLGVKELLTDDGLFVFEEPYLLDMILKDSFDQIYDEHNFIFSVMAISSICRDLDLKLIKVMHQQTHGGSMRYYVTKNLNKPIDDSVQKFIEKEFESGLHELNSFHDFNLRCINKRNALVKFIRDLKKNNCVIGGYGATSKSVTILNYCGLTKNDIDYIGDSTELKIGCVMPGTNIPIISIDEIRKSQPDFVILFAWNHESEVLTKEREFLNKTSKWIRFTPSIEILNPL